MTNSTLETIFISDQVTDGKLTFRTPIHKFQKGLWQLAIESVSIELQNTKSKIDILCCIKCSWITNLCFNLQGELISQSPILMQWFISQKKQCFNNYHLNWFNVNSLSQTITIEVINVSTKKPIEFNCKMNIHILIRQIA